jgi:hypothetical protein
MSTGTTVAGTHDTSYFETLRERRDAKRAQAPDPTFRVGCGLPHVAFGRTLAGLGWDKAGVLQEAVEVWHRFSWGGVLRAAEVLGWEKWILAIEERQSEGVTKAAADFRKQLGLTTNDMDAMAVVANAGVIGVGFLGHRTIEHTLEREVGMADWCPMIQGARDMGMQDSPAMQDFMLWCDTYDNYETRATSPDIWFTHTHCMGRGDKYCRYCVDYRSDVVKGNFYETLKSLRDTKRAEAEVDGDPAAEFAPGIGLPQPLVVQTLTDEEKLTTGVRIQRRIGTATIVIAAHLMGWDRWLEGMKENEIPRLKERSRNLGTKWGVSGTTARDATILMLCGMMGSGFDDHQVIDWTTNRCEGCARTCPLVESAKESGLEGELENMSLWCDAWHTANASAMNADINVTFTHCLGRGDALCRWVVE